MRDFSEPNPHRHIDKNLDRDQHFCPLMSKLYLHYENIMEQKDRYQMHKKVFVAELTFKA